MPPPSPGPSIINPGALSPLPMQTDETTVFEVRFSFSILIFRLILAAAITIGLIFLFRQVGFSDFFGGRFQTLIGYLPYIVGGFIALLFILNYLMTRYLLTTLRAQARTGVISYAQLNIPLSHVNDVQTQVGLIGLIFNFGTIRLASGNSILVVTFAGIASPKVRAAQISELVDKAHNWQ